MKPIPTFTQSDIDLFWSKADWGLPSACWPWLGLRKASGYGMFKGFRAHRVAYTIKHGPIPDGLTLDHLCRNKGCVNPDHLEAVAHRTNVLRGEAPTANHARKTHCEHGHEFTPENTIVRRGGRARECRACKQVRERETWRQGKRSRGRNG